MTTKKDLVEAHAFSRRRLVTAFLSGAPGGREVEPSRPGRTILGGVSIAVLLLAGAAIASVLAPRAPQDWNSQGVVVTDQGARYIVTQDNGRLRPIINLTSAQLILGLDLQTQVVSQKTVDAAKEPPGDPIGIQGAPESLPTTSRFIESGWTACTRDDAGLAVDISRTPPVSLMSAREGFVVQARSGTWLIAQTVSEEGKLEAFRYAVPDVKGALLPNIFNLQPRVALVPDAWVDLFPAGTPLGAQGFPASDGKPSGLQGPHGPLLIGQIVTYGDKYYLIRSHGWIELNDFEARVYLSLPHRPGPPTTESLSSLPRNESKESLPATSWPSERLTSPTRPEICTELRATNGQQPTVRIGTTSPGTAAWPDNPPTAADPPVQTVDAGMGAFVRSGSFGSPIGTQDYMVDSRGGAYLLQGGSTIASLGLTDYRNTKAPAVPDSWIKVLGTGTPLSTEQALCPPNTDVNRKSGSCAPAPS